MLACSGRTRPRKIGRSSLPAVQARPRFSAPLPGVRDLAMPEAEFATVGHAGEAFPIYLVVRRESRLQLPPATERSLNLLTIGHRVPSPQAVDRRVGKQCSMPPAAPRWPIYSR